MKCPKCNVTLLIAERQGVEIDYCPDCRGIWLDRGELDKIIEKSSYIEQANAVSSAQPSGFQSPGQYSHGKHHDSHYRDKHSHDGGSGHGKKKSILMDLFDF